MDVVNRVVPLLIRDGRVPTPGIGVQLAGEAVATRFGVDGLVIVSTVPGSPADRAGLRGIHPQSKTIGDVIVAVNDKPVRRLADLTDELEQVGSGKPIPLTISRGGSRTTVTVEVIDIGSPR